MLKLFKKKEKQNKVLSSMANGKSVAIEDVPDEVFSTKMMGDGIAKVGNTLLSKYCDDMITFRYETFKVGMSDILYGSTAHFFIISDFLFLRYLEYSQEKG